MARMLEFHSCIASVPDDVLENVLLEKLTAEELCVLALVSRRFKALADCEPLWASLFELRWGPSTPLVRRASQLAGGWKKLYGSKSATDKASAPWTKPCQEELAASLEKLTAAKTSRGREIAVVFLLDGSGSVNEEEFGTMLSFVESATTALKGGGDAKVAVVQFSNDTRVEYDLAPIEEEALVKATREMVRMNGGTNVAVAIQKAGQLLKRSAQVDAVRQVVLLTDGRVDSYQAHEARQMADRLADEQRNVSFFAYGVGRGVDKPELLHIIGGPPTCQVGPARCAAAAAAAAAATGLPSVPSPSSSSGSGPSSPTLSSGSSAPASPATPCVPLSAEGEEAADRYLDLCVREESPW